MLVDGLGCWISHCLGSRIAPGQPALFIDRDDVLLADPGYLHRASQVQMLDGAADVVRWANGQSISTIVVTNQSGIARGLFGWDDFHAVNQRMMEILREAGASLDAIVACAWHEDGLPPLRSPAHLWRKPNPGMFLAAGDAFGCQLSSSWMVGDRQTDMDAAFHAGLQGGVLVGPPNSVDELWLREGDASSFEVLTVETMNGVLKKLARNFSLEEQFWSSADAF